MGNLRSRTNTVKFILLRKTCKNISRHLTYQLIKNILKLSYLPLNKNRRYVKVIKATVKTYIIAEFLMFMNTE